MTSIDIRSIDLDLTNLDQEAIHNRGQIQSYGVLLVLEEPSLKIVQTSSNSYSMLRIQPSEMLNLTLQDLLDPFQIQAIETALAEDNLDYINPRKVWVRKQGDDYAIFDAVFHRNAEGWLILELEPAVSSESIPFLSFYHLARASINQLNSSSNIQDFCQIIVKEVRNVTEFDRVMLYKFDEDGHGAVVAEEKLDSLEPYLGLHYPASDIPKPARKMFASNWIRIIPDASSHSVELHPLNHPATNRPTDLTHSILRSANPCHLEYLHNMGVGASLTISLTQNNKLWGLIACHHQTPKYISYELRKACEFLGKVVFAEISNHEETQDYDYKVKLNYIRSQLVDYMAQSDSFVEGLTQKEPNLLDLAAATGAAVCFNGSWTTVGKTPTAEELNLLVQWLNTRDEGEVFATDSLPQLYPDAASYKDIASGLLAISISHRNYVLWFRPEVIQTVNWGGDPTQAYTKDPDNLTLSPRKSFELWKETVRLTSLPWQKVEVEAAAELRKAIVNLILRQADDLALLARDLELSNAELKRFAYVASHDLQEPLNHVSNYVQLLAMRYSDRLDADAKDFIDFTVQGVSLMQTLIDDVLAYSKVDLQGSQFELIEVENALTRALKNLKGSIRKHQATVTFDSMPTLLGDSTQLMQLFQNLIGNAIKFKSENAPVVHVSTERLEDHWLFSVTDNGIGIEPQFSDRIFVIFQRLHTRDEYQGTGMGLAICKKIVECHRGNIWVESELGKGATFYFTIPLGGRERERRIGRQAKNYFIGGGQPG